MITKSYLESMKSVRGGVKLPVSASMKVLTEGAYPSAYSIQFDEIAKEYRVTLEGLVTRT